MHQFTAIHRIIICLVLGFCMSGCRERFLDGLTQIEALEMQAKLSRAGVSVVIEEEKGEWIVKVDGQDMERVRSYLAGSANLLNKRKTQSLQAPSFFSSRDERNWYQLQQLSESISSSLQMIPGVLDARVHLSRDAGGFWKNEAGVKSASVLLLGIAGREFKRDEIVMLVSSASGCPGENVAVMIESEISQSASIPSREDEGNTPEPGKGIISLNNRGLVGLALGIVLLFIASVRAYGQRKANCSEHEQKAINPAMILVKAGMKGAQ